MLRALARIDELAVGTHEVAFDRVVVEVVDRLRLVLHVVAAGGGRRLRLSENGRRSGHQRHTREQAIKFARHGSTSRWTTRSSRGSENSTFRTLSSKQAYLFGFSVPPALSAPPAPPCLVAASCAFCCS